MSRPKNDDHDLEVMAAWHYYVHGMGQEQVARALDLSRTKVTRLLSHARDSGLVKITLEHELAETLALADWIAQRYGLDRCILTPPLSDTSMPEELAEQIGRQAVGIAAANFLSRRILNSGAVAFGVGGGRTLGKVVDAMRSLAKADVTVVSLVGASAVDDGTSAYQIARAMAQVTGGMARTLPVPMYLGAETTCVALAQDPVVREVLAAGAGASLNVLGCGALDASNSFRRVTGLDQADIEAAQQAGAVCEICGVLLTADGEPADTPLNRRRMGVAFADLRRIETVVVAAGARKVGALKAAIRSGIARTIVVDHDIAAILARR